MLIRGDIFFILYLQIRGDIYFPFIVHRSLVSEKRKYVIKCAEYKGHKLEIRGHICLKVYINKDQEH